MYAFCFMTGRRVVDGGRDVYLRQWWLVDAYSRFVDGVIRFCRAPFLLCFVPSLPPTLPSFPPSLRLLIIYSSVGNDKRRARWKHRTLSKRSFGLFTLVIAPGDGGASGGNRRYDCLTQITIIAILPPASLSLHTVIYQPSNYSESHFAFSNWPTQLHVLWSFYTPGEKKMI